MWAVVLQVLSTDSDAEREVFYVDRIQNGSKGVAKTTNMEPKGNHKGAQVSQ